MNDLRQAAQQALEALEDLGMRHFENTGEKLYADIYIDLRTALEQQAEPVGFEMARPVAWRFKDPKDGHWLYTTHLVDLSKKYWRLKNELFDPLYTTPQKRQWVGLTDEDFLEACQIAERGNYLLALQRIQIKLKERNT